MRAAELGWIVGDFGGDGVDTVGLHRESMGFVHFRNGSTQGNVDATVVFGEAPWLPVAGTFGLD